jgi:hypothetical protein
MKKLIITAILIASLFAIQSTSILAQDSTSCRPDSATLANILAFRDFANERIAQQYRTIEQQDSFYVAKIIEKNTMLAYDSLIMHSQRQQIHELMSLQSENRRLKRDAKIGWGATIISTGVLILSIIFK